MRQRENVVNARAIKYKRSETLNNGRHKILTWHFIAVFTYMMLIVLFQRMIETKSRRRETYNFCLTNACPMPLSFLS